MYNGGRPAFQEAGPFVYYENNSYATPQWDDQGNVNANFQQNTIYQSGDGIDTPMWQPNPASMRAWYGMVNGDAWKSYMTVLYNTVNIGLGQYPQNAWCFDYMLANYFPSSAGINTYLLASSQATQAQIDAMYNDYYYGLNNPENYWKWNQLAVTGSNNVTAWNLRLGFQSELKTVFNLNYNQIQSLTNSWNNLFSQSSFQFFAAQPTTNTYKNPIGAAYWQWANSYTTSNLITPSNPSMATYYSNLYTWYPEISYWKTNHFNMIQN